jgi:hypothetical protein
MKLTFWFPAPRGISQIYFDEPIDTYHSEQGVEMSVLGDISPDAL